MCDIVDIVDFAAHNRAKSLYPIILGKNNRSAIIELIFWFGGFLSHRVSRCIVGILGLGYIVWHLLA